MLNKHGWWFMGKKRMFMSDMLIISYQNISDNYIFSAWDLSLLPSVSSFSLSLPGVILGWVRAGTCTGGAVSSMELILCSVFRFFLSVTGRKILNSKISAVQLFPVQSLVAGIRDTIGATGVAEQAIVRSFPNALFTNGVLLLSVFTVDPVFTISLLSIDMEPTIINSWTTLW